MKLAVLGANGRSGRAFVAASLAAGHEVRAGVHRHVQLSDHPNLTILQCDATDITQVSALLEGVDAVVSLIGHVRKSPAQVQTDATKTVTQAMQRAGIKRIVSLTGTGVRQPGDRITLLDRMLNYSIRLIDLARVKDGIMHAEVLEASTLDWTILRVLKLQDVPAGQRFLSLHGPTALYVSRTQVAEAILEILEQNSYIRQMPMLSPRQGK